MASPFKISVRPILGMRFRTDFHLGTIWQLHRIEFGLEICDEIRVQLNELWNTLIIDEINLARMIQYSFKSMYLFSFSTSRNFVKMINH